MGNGINSTLSIGSKQIWITYLEVYLNFIVSLHQSLESDINENDDETGKLTRFVVMQFFHKWLCVYFQVFFCNTIFPPVTLFILHNWRLTLCIYCSWVDFYKINMLWFGKFTVTCSIADVIAIDAISNFRYNATPLCILSATIFLGERRPNGVIKWSNGIKLSVNVSVKCVVRNEQ